MSSRGGLHPLIFLHFTLRNEGPRAYLEEGEGDDVGGTFSLLPPRLLVQRSILGASGRGRRAESGDGGKNRKEDGNSGRGKGSICMEEGGGRDKQWLGIDSRNRVNLAWRESLN